MAPLASLFTRIVELLLGYAQSWYCTPPWPPPTPWSTDVITGAAVLYGYIVGPHSSGFPLTRGHYLVPQACVSGLRETFFCSVEPVEGFNSLYLYVSMNCFLTSLGY